MGGGKIQRTVSWKQKSKEIRSSKLPATVLMSEARKAEVKSKQEVLGGDFKSHLSSWKSINICKKPGAVTTETTK